MLSWQSRLLKIVFRFRNLYGKQAAFNLPRIRGDLEVLGVQWGPKLALQQERVDAGGVLAAWLVPPDADTDRVLLYFHGGAYVSGSIESHLGLAGNLGRAVRSRVFSVDYRLAPEYPFPAAVEDAVRAYRWLLSQGWDSAKVVFAGDSAGGGLAIAAALALRDNGTPLPGAIVCISPWTDLVCDGESWSTNIKADYIINPQELKREATLYLGDADPKSPLASPRYAEFSGLPPMLIQVGSAEILLSDSTEMAGRAREAEVEVTLEVWEEMQHVWHFVASFVPESHQAIEKIAAFIDCSLDVTQQN